MVIIQDIKVRLADGSLAKLIFADETEAGKFLLREKAAFWKHSKGIFSSNSSKKQYRVINGDIPEIRKVIEAQISVKQRKAPRAQKYKIPNNTRDEIVEQKWDFTDDPESWVIDTNKKED